MNPTNARQPWSGAELFTRIVCVLTVAVGLAVLAGWAFDIDTLKRVMPGLVSMVPNTAISFVFSGFALALLHHREGKPWAKRTGFACAALVTLLAGATLAEYLGGWDLGIDKLLLTEKTKWEPKFFPGRMALMTAISLTLNGTALLLLDAGRSRSIVTPAQVLALLAAFVTSLALVGYIYGVSALYALRPYSTMALHTASVCFLLSLGVLYARPQQGIMAVVTGDNLGGLVIRREIPIVVAVLLLVGWLRLMGQEQGFYETPFGAALFAVVCLWAFVLLVAWTGWSIRQIEVESQEAVQRTQLAVESANVGTWDYDPISGSLEWSVRCKEIFGLRPDEKVDFPLFENRLHPDDRQRAIGIIRKSFDPSGNGKQEVDYRVRWPDGTIRHVIANGQATFSGSGPARHMVRVMGTVVDVTERRNAEEKFQLAVESAPMAMVMIDTHGMIILANREAEKVFGYERSELLGQRVEMLVPDTIRDRHPSLREGFFAHPASRRVGGGRELFAWHRDGHEFPVEIGLSPVETPQGLLVLAAISDITQRNLAEERAQRYLTDLTHLGRIKLASEIAAGLAHELNQPLTSISVQAGLASSLAGGKNNGDSGPLIAALEVIAAQANRAGEIIRVLRTFVRKGDALRDVTQVNDVVQDLVRLVSAQLRHSHVRLSLELGPLSETEVDRIQIGQVLFNLVQNAIEAMNDTPAGKREIEISTKMDGADAILISVTDTGKGIAPENIEQVFESFYTTKSSGIGLGLAICRSIIEAHQGRLWAESHLGAGAIFRLRLPVVPQSNR